MNILVLTKSGRVIVRPDTTWEKDNEDLYAPEFVNSFSASPVLFARVLKPGRSVGKKFAERYYDGYGKGVLLYPEDLMDGSEEGYACASCLDHTSFLPYPVLDKDGLSSEEKEKIADAIAEVTRFCYIRTGDLIAIETEDRRLVSRREDGEYVGTLNSVGFKIIY